jgi:hypothetical protein
MSEIFLTLSDVCEYSHHNVDFVAWEGHCVEGEEEYGELVVDHMEGVQDNVDVVPVVVGEELAGGEEHGELEVDSMEGVHGMVVGGKEHPAFVVDSLEAIVGFW